MNEMYKVLTYLPDDERLHVSRHTNTVFPITRFHSAEEVDRRREELRFNLRMAAGLYPWPEKMPLNTKTENVGTYDGYSVKKIMFESRPGFWSTGNLYLPEPMPEKAPAILNVIGHWENQRLTRLDEADYPAQLANFARMGFVCLVTDMIGKVDSRQISHDYGRGTKELWLSNGLGVQLWNNIRALDLLCSMPFVDADNIGVTGASGGGSQTLFLSLVDERIKAAAPINMISLHMQGGCQCENAPGLRRFTDNTEMCAMLAPRALFLAGSDGDWTKNLETAELPAVLEAYRQYGAEDMVEHFYQIATHQYNAKTRHRVYSFFARHLMGKNIVWNEQPIEVADVWDLTWFRGNGRAPGIADDEAFFRAYKAERTAKISALDDGEKRKMLAWITGVRENTVREIGISTEEWDGVTVERSVICGEYGEKLPYVKLTPAGWDGKRVCLMLSGDGKCCLGRDEVRGMLEDGVRVVSGDLLLTGETAACVIDVAGTAADNRYYTTFNCTTDALRVQDAALLIQAAAESGCDVTLYADGCAARAAVCALALCGNVKSAKLERAALLLTGDDAYERDFRIPGICLIGGLEGCLALVLCETELIG
ncbi:MAG: acetylxylan esterase [Clostridia bacterium]|nr:acetylxylan esterase [Clostridia bacterium]